jgi:hypothetical protein
MSVFSESVAVGQACTQAPQETHSESMKATFWLARHLRLEAAALDGERERALLLVAGAHAARADDALAGSKVKYGLLSSLAIGGDFSPS